QADVADDEEREAERDHHGGEAQIVGFAREPHQEKADRADGDDAREHADHADVEPHVAVQDVAELVADHPLQLVARQALERAARPTMLKRLTSATIATVTTAPATNTSLGTPASPGAAGASSMA